MGDLTSNISRSEASCKCGCGFNAVDIQLAEILQDCVFHFERKYNREISIIFTSWNRCRKYNDYLREVKGIQTAINSKHIFGIAVDFIMVGISPQEVYDYLDVKYAGRFGLIIYDNRIHFDVRMGKHWREDKR